MVVYFLEGQSLRSHFRNVLIDCVKSLPLSHRRRARVESLVVFVNRLGRKARASVP